MTEAGDVDNVQTPGQARSLRYAFQLAKPILLSNKVPHFREEFGRPVQPAQIHQSTNPSIHYSVSALVAAPLRCEISGSGPAGDSPFEGRRKETANRANGANGAFGV
jgi:hypothetical protein